MIYMLLHNLHDCTFKTSFKVKSIKPIKTRLHMVCIKADGGLYFTKLIFLENTNYVTVLYNDVIVNDRCCQSLCCGFPYFKRAEEG